MARDLTKNSTTAGTAANESTLTSELLSADTYKTTQGQLVRRLTLLAIFVTIGMGAWSLHSTIAGATEAGSPAKFIWPGLLLIAGAWFGYRLINWPVFADFLIAVQAELKKVTWPSKAELKRASVVVIATIFILAMSLFLFDIVWQWIFEKIGVTA